MKCTYMESLDPTLRLELVETRQDCILRLVRSEGRFSFIGLLTTTCDLASQLLATRGEALAQQSVRIILTEIAESDKPRPPLPS